MGAGYPWCDPLPWYRGSEPFPSTENWLSDGAAWKLLYWTVSALNNPSSLKATDAFSYKVMRNCWEINPEDRPTFHKLATEWEKMLAEQVDYLDLTNNAIHNRSYFCSPLGTTSGFGNAYVSAAHSFRTILDDSDNTLDGDKETTEQLNYLNRSQSYVKCGESDKILETTAACSSHNNNNANTQGYETPVKIKRVQTPTNECPQYYTDMAAGNRKQN